MKTKRNWGPKGRENDEWKLNNREKERKQENIR